MKEYIDREATLNERPEGRNPGQVGKEEYNKGWNDCRSAFYKCITSMPAADVVEVRHGRWIGLEYDGYADGCPVYDLWECSECGEEVRGEDVPATYPWCRSCGTRMDKEDEP